jgi:hypothetical protein
VVGGDAWGGVGLRTVAHGAAGGALVRGGAAVRVGVGGGAPTHGTGGRLPPGALEPVPQC